WHDVDGELMLRLRHEKHLDTLAVAGVQPGVSHDVPLALAAPLGGRHGGRVAGHAVWANGARRVGLAPSRHCVCVAKLLRVFGLRLCGAGQVHGDFYPVEPREGVRALCRGPAVRAAPVRHRVHAVCHVLLYPRGYAQHCGGRHHQVLHHDGGLRGHCRHCLPAAARARVGRRVCVAGRAGAQLRHAENPEHALARRGQQNERVRVDYPAAHSLRAHHRPYHSGFALLPPAQPESARWQHRLRAYSPAHHQQFLARGPGGPGAHG
nr:hypothetical protein [Tanacetum cinerariifolium]